MVHLLGTEFRWSSGQASMARAIARGEIGTPKLATILLHIPMLGEVQVLDAIRRSARDRAWVTIESS